MTGLSVREVTEAEVGAFRENGWVLLRGLVRPESTSAILAEVTALMGADAQQHKSRENPYAAVWRTLDEPSHASRPLWDFATSPALGRAGSRFLRDRPVRFLRDEVYVKMPGGEGEGASTPWHQDFAYANRDCSEQVNFWIALRDVGEHGGGMRYLSGSHRAGLLGRALDAPDHDLLARYPELAEEYPSSAPMRLRPGDAFVHHALVVHGAWPNTSAAIRWAYTVVLFHADARYTGAPWPSRLAGTMRDIRVNQPFNHPLTPVVWPTEPTEPTELTEPTEPTEPTGRSRE